MIIACFNDMLSIKYNGYTVYVHNLAGFDGELFYKIIVEYFDIKPKASNKGVIFSYELKKAVDNNKIKLQIKDSKKILPSSLRKLGKSFNVPILKGIFPYKFVNEYNLNYIGDKPSINNYKIYDLIENSYDEIENNFKNNKIMFDLDLIKSDIPLPYGINKYFEFNKKDFPEIDYFNENKLALLEYNKIKKKK